MSSDDLNATILDAAYIASWFGSSIAVRMGEASLGYFEGFHADDLDAEVMIPSLPDADASLQCMYLPMENLLLRPFSLPLLHPRLIEADMLGQELVEMAGIEPSDWWLAWHAVATDDGVVGMVFGLPQAMRDAMSEDHDWKDCPQLRVDGWERLSHAKPDDMPCCAVIDADQEGIFIGYVDQGIWQGMRRLNWQAGHDVVLGNEDMADQIVSSWVAMGWNIEADAVVGCVGEALGQILKTKTSLYQVTEEASLLDRHAANVRLFDDSKPLINFRRGRWAVRSGMKSIKPWYRSFAMVAVLCVVWMGTLIADIASLENKIESYGAKIEQAFHRGLPHEKVMLDPLAQLKRAAKGSVANEDAQYFFRQLDAVSSLYKDGGWTLRELAYKKGKVHFSGTAKSLDVLNTFKDALQKKVENKISLSETDISGKEVIFRMYW